MTAPALPHAPPESVGLNPERLKRLSAVMAREIEEGKAPGLAMLIARNGKIGFHQTMGALKPGGPPMREDAIFRIYSMTKPIVSVATMTLVEEGRLLLSEPVAKYLPQFASMTVGVERDGKFERVPAARPITILDLMRHTSGFTYGFLGTSPVHRLTHEAYILSQNRSMDEHLADLAALPLLRQPGEVWEYGHSTDVLGRVVEIIAGMSLGRLLETRVFQPLGMVDTAFYTPTDKLDRRAEAFPSGFKRTRPRRPGQFDRAAAMRIRRHRPRLDDGRLRAILRHASRRRRARERAPALSARIRLHDHRPARRRHHRAEPDARARPRLRPRFRRSSRTARLSLWRRRRIPVGRMGRNGVLGVAARSDVRDLDGPGAGIPRFYLREMFRNLAYAALD